jgi:murein hydrolase activator
MNKYLLLLITSVALSSFAWAGAPSEKKTKIELSQVERNMVHIKSQINEDKHSRSKLYQSLGLTEKKLGEDLHQLHNLNIEEEQKKQAVIGLVQRINLLNQQLHTQQIALGNHVRARHRLGSLHPWEWLLHQESPRTMARLFVFYHYLFKADQQLIDQVRETTGHVEKNQVVLSSEQKKLQALEAELTRHQTHLVRMKREQNKLIEALDETIQTKRDKLKTYRQDKARLRALLKTLAAKKYHPHPKSFNLERSNLPYPLKGRAKETKPLNQGIVFLAREGTPVVAVLSGKVIFSDWLKGYGLLIIIDHGEGMLSLYAHNASLFIAQGGAVKQGQQIATVGHTGGLRENGLYFEVRRRGRAIPPRQWMS